MHKSETSSNLTKVNEDIAELSLDIIAESHLILNMTGSAKMPYVKK